jgi:hypothetical protein
VASSPIVRVYRKWSIAPENTYTRELDAAVTAFRSGASLLEVKRSEVTTRSLDDSGLVGGSVVARERTRSVPLCCAFVMLG